MRMSRDELIEKYPCWNEERHDIVRVMYGDDPLILWNEEYYKRWSTYTGTASNIEAVNAYMWSQNGDYNIYRTLVGEIYITTEGRVLGGSINVKYRGVTYTLSLNLMYGFRSLDILKLSGEKVRGFSNVGGLGSPSNSLRTEELNKETTEKILFDLDLSDYGESVKKFMEMCGVVYTEDSVNHILEKTFELRR